MQAGSDYQGSDAPAQQGASPSPQTTPTPTQTLGPQDYLQWMLSLERSTSMPEGTRAYLVTKGPNNARQLRPVGMEDSVLNLKTDLIRHLASDPLPTGTLEELRDLCNEQLEERGADASFKVNKGLTELGRAATYEIQCLATILRRHIEEHDTTGQIIPVARGMLLRMELLSDVAYDAIPENDYAESMPDLNEVRRKVFGSAA